MYIDTHVSDSAERVAEFNRKSVALAGGSIIQKIDDALELAVAAGTEQARTSYLEGAYRWTQIGRAVMMDTVGGNW
jgi:hypothetical protein